MEKTIIYANIATNQAAVFDSNMSVNEIYDILKAAYPEDNIEDWVVKNPTILSMVDVWIGALLNDAAKSIGYESAVSAISYTDSNISKYAAEARRILYYRDALWNKYETLDSAEEMSEDEFIQLMPSFKTFLLEPTATSDVASAEENVQNGQS